MVLLHHTFQQGVWQGYALAPFFFYNWKGSKLNHDEKDDER